MNELAIALNGRQTLIIAILVLFLGKYLNKNVAFFRAYNIPEPVTGGVLASILAGVVFFVFGRPIEFELHQRDVLLVIFFTTIGLSARVSTLLEGGRHLVILAIAALIYLGIQDLTGIGVSTAMGLDSVVGVLGGSVALSGGHGTVIAWAPTFSKEYGIAMAMEIGIAAATFGLVLGGVLGGPIAGFLIKRHKLEASTHEHITVGIEHSSRESIDVDKMLNTLLIIAVAVGVGLHLHQLLEHWGVRLPLFVTCLFGGILLTNTVPKVAPRMPWPTGTATLALVSDLSLGLFLAMSLMSLQLWTLINLALPIVALLIAQVAVVTLFTIFVIFRILGRNYDAAVMSAGYVGLALGATPTAMANMTEVTKKFGASPRAFIVVPLIGAFFIDISNAIVIKVMLEMFG